MPSVESIAAPWLDGRPSIHSLIVDALAVRGSHERSPLKLNLPQTRLNRLGFGPGAGDTLAGRPDNSPGQTKARRLIAAITNALRHPSTEAMTHLYALLKNGETIRIIDKVLASLSTEIGEQRPQLAVLARRLVEEAPDIEPVKAGLALLGLSGAAADAALVSIAGRYEEFTIYSAVALRKLLSDPEPAIWSLAKEVHGWGRIRAVPYLITTTNPAVKDWMLREGFRNCILDEYLAYICALGGGLRAALAREEIDADLLAASADLLCALIPGGPAKSIEDYSAGAEVCISFLRHMIRKPVRDPKAIGTVIDIRELGEGERADRLRALPGWTPQVFFEIRSLTHEFLRRADIRSIVERGLASADSSEFHAAARIAWHFSIDPWPLHYARQQSNPSAGQWYWLMETDDSVRVEQVIALAREQIDFASIGSGPTTSLGLGREYVDDQALDALLQGLRRFPGMGSDLVLIGLRARVIGTRNMAVSVLQKWSRDMWPADALQALRRAAEREADETVRESLETLLRGPSG